MTDQLRITCDRCGHALRVLGALVFSPPNHGSCGKRHVCVDCWQDLAHWFTREPEPAPEREARDKLRTLGEFIRFRYPDQDKSADVAERVLDLHQRIRALENKP